VGGRKGGWGVGGGVNLFVLMDGWSECKEGKVCERDRLIDREREREREVY